MTQTKIEVRTDATHHNVVKITPKGEAVLQRIKRGPGSKIRALRAAEAQR